MSWEAELEVVIARTGAENLRSMCSEAYHDHTRMRAKISAMAREPEGASFPPVITQIGNGLVAIGRVAGAALKGQSVWVPLEALEERRSECMTCDQLVGERCKLCGCFYNKKIRLANEACPMSPPKWTDYKGEVNHETLD
jgi:hypothetical protein